MNTCYNEGDRVLLKTFHEIENSCDAYTIDTDPGLVDEMVDYLGSEVTLTYIDSSEFMIEEDCEEYSWHLSWIKKFISSAESRHAPPISLLPKELFEL